MIIAQIENQGRLVDQCRIAGANADRIDAAFEGAEQGPGPGIAGELAVIVGVCLTGSMLVGLQPEAMAAEYAFSSYGLSGASPLPPA